MRTLYTVLYYLRKTHTSLVVWRALRRNIERVTLPSRISLDFDSKGAYTFIFSRMERERGASGTIGA